MSARPELEALAGELGIVPAFFGLDGQERRAPDSTREALIAAMGHDASSEAAAAASRRALAEERRVAWVDPVHVWREHAAQLPRVELRPGPGSWRARLALSLEDGRGFEALRPCVAGPDGTVSVSLPVRPPPGYHDLEVELDDGRAGSQRFIGAPRSAPRCAEVLGGRRAFGVAANLYSVRGARGLGHGDLGHLELLLRAVARAGGDFVGLGPLHALRNRGNAISPYSPLSRLWRNPLYIDLERVPEWSECAAARALVLEGAGLERARALRAATHIDHEAVGERKLAVLRELYRAFSLREAEGVTERGRDFARHRETGGSRLADFATFEVLARVHGHEADWRRWPASLHHPRKPSVAAFRREHAEEIEFRAWLQFELTRQLGEVALGAREAGLGLGLIHDLAVGAPPDSADAWVFGHLLASGVSLGAPPDAFAVDGQNWGLLPFVPRALEGSHYGLWSQLLRASLEHAGGLRIDHAIGLERAFWIPDGVPGSEGAYVEQPTEDLLGVLALEAQRAGALVIGEDLGVVPVGLKQRLASWGLLSTSVLLFERDGRAFRAPQRYSPRALVTATTHDLVPLEGYAEGVDLTLRAELEGRAAELGDALEQRRADLRELERALDAAQVAPGSLAGRVHRFLSRSPAPLLALGLDDLAGEREPINLPGISTARHRSWSRRMTLPVEELELDPTGLEGRARALGAGSGRGPGQDGAP